MKVIKYFSAPWCGPCKMFKPIMKELQSEGVNIEFIDVDVDRNQAVEYGVRSVPTCIILNNGEIRDKWIGAIPKQQVKNRYNKA